MSDNENFELKVKTRENKSPQGKARVYFSCHPDDSSIYLDEICAEIFETQDCAVYYIDPQMGMEAEGQVEADLREELSVRLADMQLFVIPLTIRYLTEKSRAIEFEYAFAMENHIPILPIAVEKDIDQIFADKMNEIKPGYGNIQFLDRTSSDRTEISYEEKLKKKLSAILIGDEVAERVRAAFDAYIFLSYRKKDRRYAKELMQLIHDIPFCRDIAIWYDEFLVPGEGWNQAIADAMAKSKLVTLAVTPSLTEPGNFIIEHEYPDAIATGKKVVPAELVATDHDMLSKLFDGLDVPVDGQNLDAMTEALREIAVTENDDKPEHNFLIGLAYLGGIDMERDSYRAKKLITSAAEAGLPEAMKKLAEMYNNGNGTLDFEYWQKKYIEKLEETGEDPEEILRATEELGDVLEDASQVDEAEKAYAKMGDLAQKLLETEENREEMLKNAYRGYSKLGKSFLSEHYYEKARTALLMALEMLQKMEKPDDYSLADIYENIGTAYFNDHLTNDNRQQARNYYEKNFAIYKQLTEENGSVDARRGLSWAYHNLSYTVNDDEFVAGKATEYLEKSLELREQLYKEENTIWSIYDVCSAYSRMAECITSMTDPERKKSKYTNKDAEEYYQKSLKLREQVHSKIQTLSSERILARSFNELAEFYNLYGDDNVKTREYYDKSEKSWEYLAQKTHTVSDRKMLYHVYSRLMLYWNNSTENHLKYAERVVKLAENLEDETETGESQKELAIAYGSLGQHYSDMNNADRAIEYCLKGIEEWKKFTEIHTESQNMRNMYYAYDRLGKIYMKFGRFPEAAECFMASLKFYEREIKENAALDYSSMDSRTQSGVYLAHAYALECCKYLGGIMDDQGKISEAEMYLRRQLEEAEWHYRVDEMHGHEFDREWIWERLGDLAARMKNVTKAMECYQNALDIMNRPVEDYRQDYQNLRLWGFYEFLTIFCKTNSMPEKADEYQKKSQEAEQLVDEHYEAERRFLAGVKQQCEFAENYMKEKDFAKAKYDFRYILSRCRLREKHGEDNQVKMYIIGCYKALGQIEWQTKEYGVAEEYYSRGLKIAQEMQEKKPDNTYIKRQIIDCCGRMGDVSLSMGKKDAAKEYYRKSLEEQEKLVREIGAENDRQMLSVAYVRQARLENTHENLEKAYEIVCKLSDNAPEKYKKQKELLESWLK